MAELRDIENCEQGTDFNPTFILRNPDRSYFDLTGYTARMQVRASFDSDEVLISLTTVNGKLVISAPGRIQLNLAPADTSALSFTGEALSAIYDIEVISGTGKVTRVAQGAFNISREVTR